MPRGGWHPAGGVYRPAVVIRPYRDAYLDEAFNPPVGPGGVCSIRSLVEAAVENLGAATVGTVMNLGFHVVSPVTTAAPASTQLTVESLGQSTTRAVESLGKHTVGTVTNRGTQIGC